MSLDSILNAYRQEEERQRQEELALKVALRGGWDGGTEAALARFFIADEKLQALHPFLSARTNVLTNIDEKEAEFLYYMSRAAMFFHAFVRGVKSVDEAEDLVAASVPLYTHFKRGVRGFAWRMAVSSFQYRAVEIGRGEERRGGFLHRLLGLR